MRASAKTALILPIAGLVAGWLISNWVTPRYVVTARLALGDSLSPSFRASDYLGQLKNDLAGRASLPAATLRNATIETESSTGSYITFRITFTDSEPGKANGGAAAVIDKLIQWHHFHSTEPAYAKHRTGNERLRRIEARLVKVEKRLGTRIELSSHAADPPFVPDPPESQDTWRRPGHRSEPPPVVVGPLSDFDGVPFEVIDPPGAAVKVYPDAVRFMTGGFAAGLLLSVAIVLFARQPATPSLMEQSA